MGNVRWIAILRILNNVFVGLPLVGLGLTMGTLITDSPRAIEFAAFTVASTAVAAYYEWSSSR